MKMLPNLPRILKKKEASITPRINAFMAQYAPPCCAWEIKTVKGSSCPKKAVLEHQIRALRAVMSPAGVVHKLSDEARRQQPFDAFKIASASAYVVVHYQKHKTCIVYDAGSWNGATIDSPCVWRFKI